MNVGTVMIAAQPEILRTTSFCSAVVTAMLACRIVESRSRWAMISSLTSLRWSSTSRKYWRSPSLMASTPPWVIAAAGPSSGCTAR